MTVIANRPAPPVDLGRKYFLPVSIIIFLVIIVLLPDSVVGQIWPSIGISIVLFGTGYAFVTRNVTNSLILAIIYTSMFEAPSRYLTSEKAQTAVSYIGRDLIIYSLILGIILFGFGYRLKADKRTDTPPLVVLFIFFGLNLLIEFFNFNSYSPLASFVNGRLFWEMIPLYFLGYYYIRDVASWRKLFLTIACVSVINGGVAVYQSSIGPAKVAAWGPGYQRQIYERGRTIRTEDNEETFRPMALGGDSGYSGALGLVSVPMIGVLLTFTRKAKTREELQRSFLGRIGGTVFVYALAIGVAVAVYASSSRTALVSSFVAAAVSLFLLSQNASKARILIATLAASTLVLIALPIIIQIAPYIGTRYATITNFQQTFDTFFKEGRDAQVTIIPFDIASRHPLGAGLDNLGPGAEFVNTFLQTPLRPQYENAENNITLTLVGLGIPGFILWIVLHFAFLTSAWRAQKQVRNYEIRTYILGGTILISIFFVFWPFGNLTSFPQNMFFWLIPGMIFGTAKQYKDDIQAGRRIS